MIKGMTGYGNMQFSAGHIKAIVEIKSLNHRYLDISFYLPIGFGSLEDKMRQIIQTQIQRGRVTVSVKIVDRPPQGISLNREAVKKHLKYASLLKREFGLKNDLTLSDLIRLPGVVEVTEVLVHPKEIWPDMEKCLKKTLVGLTAMRKREGRSLAADILDQLKGMSLQINKIRSGRGVILKDKEKILTPEEFGSFQKNSDVNEEIARLQHYIGELKLLLKSSSSIGKSIDFIAQEMQRETNTIGSKLQDSIVSSAVIALKDKIEKIREQSQNIE